VNKHHPKRVNHPGLLLPWASAKPSSTSRDHALLTPTNVPVLFVLAPLAELTGQKAAQSPTDADLVTSPSRDGLLTTRWGCH
jgi:hypothetical protein